MAGATGPDLWICGTAACQDNFQTGKSCAGCKRGKPKIASPSSPQTTLPLRAKDVKILGAAADLGKGSADAVPMTTTDLTQAEAGAAAAATAAPLTPSETAVKTKYLNSQEKMLQIAVEGAFPQEEISALEVKIQRLKKELDRKGLQSHVEISTSRLWHEDRFGKEKTAVAEKIRRATEDQKATQTKRQDMEKKQREDNLKKMENIKVSFDKFDLEAAQKLAELQKEAQSLQDAHAENMKKFQAADEQVVASGGGQPAYIPSSVNIPLCPVITPYQVDRGVIDGHLAQAVRTGAVALTQEQGQWIASFVQGLLESKMVSSQSMFGGSAQGTGSSGSDGPVNRPPPPTPPDPLTLTAAQPAAVNPVLIPVSGKRPGEGLEEDVTGELFAKQQKGEGTA